MRYHALLTIKSGTNEATLDADITITPGAAQASIFKDLRRQLIESMRENLGMTMIDPVVLFYRLEPMEIAT